MKPGLSKCGNTLASIPLSPETALGNHASHDR